MTSHRPELNACDDALSPDQDIARFLLNIRTAPKRAATFKVETLADKWRMALELWEEYILKTSPSAG
ncbi:MAG: hypothetical protein IPK79_06710 [Vampirovibrionales bacterium]|nr:hypothetical protein [Vampirovibrionales bacterium]